MSARTLDDLEAWLAAWGSVRLQADEVLAHVRSRRAETSSADTRAGSANEVTALRLARRYLDVREIPGGTHNPLIQAWHYQAKMGRGVADEVPWCGSFVNHVAFLLDLPRPDLPARARSWLTVGRPVDLDEAEPGWDVVVLRRGAAGQPGPEVLDAPGHVTFFDGWETDSVSGVSVVQDRKHLWGVGGNQGNKVSLARYPSASVLGIRRLRG